MGFALFLKLLFWSGTINRVNSAGAIFFLFNVSRRGIGFRFAGEQFQMNRRVSLAHHEIRLDGRRGLAVRILPLRLDNALPSALEVGARGRQQIENRQAPEITVKNQNQRRQQTGDDLGVSQETFR